MHTVWFLLLPGFSLLDVSGPLAVFATANALLKVEGEATEYYTVRLVGTQDGPVVSSSGIPLSAAAVPRRIAGTANALVVAGGSGALQVADGGAAIAPGLREWLAYNQRALRRGASSGKDAFVLVQDSADNSALRSRPDPHRSRETPGDRPVSSHSARQWASMDALSGIDLALSWVEQDHGRPLADAVALHMPEPRGRTYGARGFRSALVEHRSGDERINELHLWIARHLQQRLTVSRLAQEAMMSARSFARFYGRATGLTPARAIEQIRLDAACRLIETSVRPLKAIAAQCGYGSQEVMRRAFVRNLKLTPAEYRRRHVAGGQAAPRI